jgi:hypothetical protein
MTQDKRWMTVDLDGTPTRVHTTGEPMTLRDLILMLEQEAANRGLHTTPGLEHARKLRDEATS